MTDSHSAAPLRLLLIQGSVRAGRFSDHVAGWAAAHVAGDARFALSRLDPREAGVTPWHEDMGAAPLAALRGALDAADGFVMVTPEINHAYPAALKALVDAGRHEWAAKPVGFVSYGGVSGGLRAVEQLRLVMAELNAHGLRDSVSFASAGAMMDEAGAFAPAQAARTAMTAMLDRLDWWGRALRDARGAAPLPGLG